jgi:mono/diheme cytochrome c family protein
MRFVTLVAFGLGVGACNGDGGDTGDDADGGDTDEPTRTEAILALTPDLTNGEEIWGIHCTACHGQDGAGLNGLGSDIRGTDQAVTVATFFDPPDLMIQTYPDILSDQDMADVSGYLETEL